MSTAAAPRPARRERKKQATRQALSDAGVQLFANRGFDATTVDDIAESVDVSTRVRRGVRPPLERSSTTNEWSR
jgi:Bacterial regulatory proteins, tetR family